jgi:hypothetical protein
MEYDSSGEASSRSARLYPCYCAKSSAWSVVHIDDFDECGPLHKLAEHRGGNLQRCCQPVHEDIDRLIHLRQSVAGMAKKCQLHGKAQTIGGTAPPRHKGSPIEHGVTPCRGEAVEKP